MVHRIRKEAGIANPAVYGVSKSPSMGWEWGYSCHIVSLLQKIVKKSIEIAPAAREEKSGWMAKYGSEYRFTGAGFDEEPPVDWGDEDGEYASIEEEE
ncbi:hypothetical protein PHISCL_06065 [Aspergillus sclerotialis]|uniref:Uncharacterized protein n=1 Tax=Aspergillus sclerotialis TaxID=2070753 RepID=A0A3A2ZUD6_9EURO|nr:hypothetical protein PHISCL_06065 [Aspergillus sclerotialis]